MSTKTRRVSQDELTLLKQMQNHLAKRKMKFSQVELSELITRYVSNNFQDFIRSINTSTQDKNKDPLMEWLDSPFDGEEETNSVEEHDVVL